MEVKLKYEVMRLGLQLESPKVSTKLYIYSYNIKRFDDRYVVVILKSVLFRTVNCIGKSFNVMVASTEMDSSFTGL